MKKLVLIKSIILGLVLQLLSSIALGDVSATLLISINHTVPQMELQKYITALERIDVSMGTCSFNATVSDYIPYEQVEDINYYGVALVQVDEVCAQEQLKTYIQWIEEQQKKGIYTLYSNPIVGPTPVFSGRN